MSKAIVVTGGAGYIGSQLIRDLAADERFREHPIRIYDNLQRHSHPVLLDLPSTAHYKFVEGDILDRVTLSDTLKDAWAVIHLAAVVSTPISFDHPVWTYQVNHWGTSMVVDEAVKAGVERFIYACSASVYGPGGVFHEADTCAPIGAYSVSKLQGEQVVMEAGAHRNLRVTSLRLGNVFGNAAGIRFEAVGNRFAYLAGTGKSLVIHGEGEQKRPMIHVRDTSAAIRFSLANAVTEARILNTSSQNVSVNELVEAVRQTMPEVSLRYTDQDALTEVSFEIDNAELLKLGWQPAVSLKDGLSEIIQRLSALHRPE